MRGVVTDYAVWKRDEGCRTHKTQSRFLGGWMLCVFLLERVWKNALCRMCSLREWFFKYALEWEGDDDRDIIKK